MSTDNFNYTSDFYSIHYKKHNDWLTVEWIGFQSRDSVPEGCEKMLKVMQELEIEKVLNINIKVKGLWDAAWVAKDWFPRMKVAGLNHFAWVISSEPLCAEVGFDVVRLTPVADVIKYFYNVEEAEDWLRQVNNK